MLWPSDVCICYDLLISLLWLLFHYRDYCLMNKIYYGIIKGNYNGRIILPLQLSFFFCILIQSADTWWVSIPLVSRAHQRRVLVFLSFFFVVPGLFLWSVLSPPLTWLGSGETLKLSILLPSPFHRLAFLSCCSPAAHAQSPWPVLPHVPGFLMLELPRASAWPLLSSYTHKLGNLI